MDIQKYDALVARMKQQDSPQPPIFPWLDALEMTIEAQDEFCLSQLMESLPTVLARSSIVIGLDCPHNIGGLLEDAEIFTEDYLRDALGDATIMNVQSLWLTIFFIASNELKMAWKEVRRIDIQQKRLVQDLLESIAAVANKLACPGTEDYVTYTELARKATAYQHTLV